MKRDKLAGMVTLLWALSLFYLFAGMASLGRAMRLTTREERAHWRSKRLHGLALFTCWSFPLAALGAAVLAWRHFEAGRLDSAPIILAPIGWLLAMGLLFAVIDYLEDGVLGNARAPRPPDQE